ncbi:RICIN domain-containing protein [Streptomyces sp. NPDC001315]
MRALGKCLDANGRGTANGTQIESWNCTGGTDQQWTALLSP